MKIFNYKHTKININCLYRERDFFPPICFSWTTTRNWIALKYVQINIQRISWGFIKCHENITYTSHCCITMYRTHTHRNCFRWQIDFKMYDRGGVCHKKVFLWSNQINFFSSKEFFFCWWNLKGWSFGVLFIHWLEQLRKEKVLDKN